MAISSEDLKDYPELASFVGSLSLSPLLKASIANIKVLYGKYGREYLDLGEQMLALLKKLDLNGADAFEDYIYHYIRDLAAFEKMGRYDNGSFEEIRAKIYDNENLMARTYLPGLFIAYAFTTLLHEKLRFFERSFSGRLCSGMVGSEIGFGDGFYLWRMLTRHQNLRVQGFDISEHAVTFTDRLLSAAAIAPQRYRLEIGNVCERLAVEDGVYDWCILAEVIEHVADPGFTLTEVRRIMKPGALLYLATVIDSNHMDHITNFETPAEIEGLLTKAGHKVVDRLVYRVNSELKTRDRAVGVAFVCECVEPC